MALEIAPEKVAHVIIKAREYDVKVGAWNASTRAKATLTRIRKSILEDFANDPTRAELAGFIDALNDDEQAHLVALAWIGRGTFEAEELDEAVETATRGAQVNSTARYLLGIPLLADYPRGGSREARLLRRGCRERRDVRGLDRSAPQGRDQININPSNY